MNHKDTAAGTAGKNVTQDGLDEYIRVSKPGILVIIVALLIVNVAVLLWGILGTLPVTETITGVVLDRNALKEAGLDDHYFAETDDNLVIYCFVDASRFNGEAVRNFTDKVFLKMPDQTQFTGIITDVAPAPISLEEVNTILFDNDWVTEQCVSSNYNWWIIIKPDQDLSQYQFMLTQITIVTEQVRPIRFLIK